MLPTYHVFSLMNFWGLLLFLKLKSFLERQSAQKTAKIIYALSSKSGGKTGYGKGFTCSKSALLLSEMVLEYAG